MRAVDLVTDRRKGRIYTVGRLDEDTEGLVLLTNDGEFANRISHPRYGVHKTYWVDVRGRVDEETLRRMHAGVRLAEGWSKFERVRVAKKSEERSILFVTLGEGKNREVRRVLANLGLPVRTLRRVAIGSLRDRKLKIGQWRPLSLTEVGELLEETGEDRRGRGTVERGFSLRPELRKPRRSTRPRAQFNPKGRAHRGRKPHRSTH